MLVLRNILLLLTLLGVITQIACYIVEPGPTVRATKGAVWPKPQRQVLSNSFYIVRPQAFEFRVCKNVFILKLLLKYQLVQRTLFIKLINHQNI